MTQEVWALGNTVYRKCQMALTLVHIGVIFLGLVMPVFNWFYFPLSESNVNVE